MFVYIAKWGFPGGAVIKNPPANTRDSEIWVPSLGGEDLLEPPPVFLPGKFHGQRRLVGLQSIGLQRVKLTEQLSAHILENDLHIRLVIILSIPSHDGKFIPVMRIVFVVVERQ